MSVCLGMHVCEFGTWDDKWGKHLGESDKGKVVQVMCNVSPNDRLTKGVR